MAQIFENSFRPVDLGKAGDATELIVKKALEVLPENYTVFLNYEATNASGRILGEFDTIVVTPTGAVVVLEIKAGSLRADASGNLVRSYEGKVKNINVQIQSQARLIQRRLKARFPHQYLRFRQFLVLPFGKIKNISSFNRGTLHVIDSSQFKDLAAVISEVDRNPITGDVPATSEIIEFFQGIIDVSSDISAFAKGQNAIGDRDSEELSKWVSRIETVVPVIEVEAPAGGGKTRLAVTLLKKAVDCQEKAIYLGFTRNNIERLRKTPIASKLRFFGTWHEFSREVTHETVDLATLTNDEKADWFEKVSEKACKAFENSEIFYDTIVIDGAEDFRVAWISALANALTSRGHIYILRDNFLYSEYARPEFEPSDYILVRSTESARVSKNLANEMIRLGVVSPDFVGNRYIKEIQFDFLSVKNGDFKKETGKVLQEAINQGYETKEIVLLTAHGLSSSQLIKREELQGFRFRKPTGTFGKDGDMIFTEGEIFFDTVRRFKGLNSPCVIVTEWDYAEFGDKEKSLLYLAMTRASIRLVILMSQESIRAIQEVIAK